MLLLRGEGEREIAGLRVAEITAQQHLILPYWNTLQTPPNFWMSTNSRLKKKKKKKKGKKKEEEHLAFSFFFFF
jgi:hypothetical protein